MSPTLAQKIDRLPAEKQAEVESFVDRLAVSSTPNAYDAGDLQDTTIKRMRERRARLLQEHGLFPDSALVIRELREHGA